MLGQSFGGFCTVSYLSLAPDGIREAFITGGLPGLAATADDVYRLTYPIVAERNQRHYERYPQDADRARDIARYLASHEVTMPDGGQLTVPAFQCLGRMLGMSPGSDTLHYLLEDAFAGGVLTDSFLARAAAELSFAAGAAVRPAAGGVLRAGLRDPLGRGPDPGRVPRVRPGRGGGRGHPAAVHRRDDLPLDVRHRPGAPPAAGRRRGSRARAMTGRRCTTRPGWRPATVPAAAAVYFEDMYVPAELSLPTARAIRGLRPWVTNEYQHDGLRVSDGAVLGRLIALARGPPRSDSPWWPGS